MKKLLILFTGWIVLAGLLFALAGYILIGPFYVPRMISWEAKNADRKCEGAIAGSLPWPSETKAACRAMNLCANEAVLNNEQQASLMLAIRRLPDCEDP